MSLTQLRCFVAIAEEGTVTRAAARCFVSQPPLRRQLLALEDELSVKLFERSSKGMQLSEAGRRLLEQARQILALVEAASAVGKR